MVSGPAWRPGTGARSSLGVAPGVARSSLPESGPNPVITTGPAPLGPDRRLPDKAAFDQVFSAPDIRCRRHPFSLLARRRGEDRPARLGLVVGKRHARRAVDRNRIRRILREHFRRTGLREVDVVVLARPGAAAVDRAELHAAARWLFERLARQLGGSSSC